MYVYIYIHLYIFIYYKKNIVYIIWHQEIMSHTYMTLVEPTLKYCSMVWDPHSQSCFEARDGSTLGAMWVKNDYVKHSSITQMLTDLQWQELRQHRTDERLPLMYKIIHNLILIKTIKYAKL